MFVSVIMNTYNRADFLRFALHAYLRQTEGDFEIILADDGSTDETLKVVDEFARQAPFELIHVWHEHMGHRRAAILNRAMEKAKGEIILFTDCDSLAFSNLVELHRRYYKLKRLVSGGYYRLNEEQTKSLTLDDVNSGRFERIFTLGQRWRAFRNSVTAMRQVLTRKPRKPHNKGVNYSASREMLFEINGYDETFMGWGSADGDVRDRLRSLGVMPCSLYHKAMIAHMWHPSLSTKSEDRQRNRIYAKRDDRETICKKGIRNLAEKP